MVATRRSSTRAKKKKTTGPPKKKLSTTPKEGSALVRTMPAGTVANFVNSCGSKITLKGPSRPPRGVPKDNDLHQPAVHPLEPTTVIGKKLKKRYLQGATSEERHSELKANPSDLFSCNIDRVSEAEIVGAVCRINYSIDTMVSNILDQIKGSKLSYYKPGSRPTKPGRITPTGLAQFLQNPQLSDNTRDSVVEAWLHDVACCLLNGVYFSGKHFFGIGEELLHDRLETMFSILVAENSTLTMQRWRSMCVEAAFQMPNSDNVVSKLNDRLITGLGRVLNIAFSSPRSKKINPSCESIVLGERQSLLDIIYQARQLSFMMQHNIVSCQLLVTIAPVQPSSGATTSTSSSGDVVAAGEYKGFEKAFVNSVWEDIELQDGDKVFGTYAFGLQKMSGSKCDILIRPRVVTSTLVRSI